MAEQPFSLVIGERYLTLADVERTGHQYRAETLGFEEHSVTLYQSQVQPEVNAIAVLVQRLVRDAGLKKKPVNIVVPDTYAYSQIIEMPLLTEKELLSAIKYQADQLIPVPIDQVNLDIEVLYEDKKNRKLSLLLVACPIGTIDRLVNSIEAAGLAPNAIENETSAVLRLISDIARSQPAPAHTQADMRLFINFGYSSTSLYLFHQQAKIPIQIHNFSLGYSLFLKDIQANLNTSYEDTKKLLSTIGFSTGQSTNLQTLLSSPLQTVVGEVERFIIAAKTRFNSTISSIVLFGEGCRIQSLDKQLASSLGMTIGFYDLTPYFIKNNVIDFFKNNWVLFVSAVGAGLRQ